MFKKASMKLRLMLILGFAVLNVVGVGGIAIYFLNNVVKNYGHLAEVNMPALRAINEARNAQRSIVVLMLTSNMASTEHAVKDVEKVKEEFEKSVSDYEEATETYHALTMQDGEKPLRASVDAGWKEITDATRKILSIAGSETPADLATRAQLWNNDLKNGRKNFKESFEKLTDYHDAEAKKWSAEAKKSAAAAEQVVIWTTLAGGLLVMFAGYQMATVLSRKLATISQKISDASVTATQATQQVSSASDQLASSSTEQASSIQETAAAMEEISAMVSKNASSAESTRNISLDSQKKAMDGKEVVLQMVNAIEQISQSNLQIGTQIESSNREMTEITKVIAEIESKTKVINDIVFQTKLLSFNASVEAARAGEHGKGFAVVAEEVGNLAQMSGSASQSITEILREGTQRVQEIIERSSSQIERLLQDNKAKIAGGVQTAERCRAVLDELVDNVTQVAEMASNIAVASQEQSHGIREVNSAVSQLGTVVEETNTSSQSLSTASLSLLGQTETMNNVVKELTAAVAGEESAKAA